MFLEKLDHRTHAQRGDQSTFSGTHNSEIKQDEGQDHGKGGAGRGRAS